MAEELQLLEARARGGDPEAAGELARVYALHHSPTRKMQRDMPKWAQLAAEAGNPDGVCALGVCLAYGLDRPRDRDHALLMWHPLATEDQHPWAMYLCGVRYMEDREFGPALKAFEFAAERGFTPALCALGACHGRGFGVVADAVRAAAYYEQAAVLGCAVGRFWIAGCYLEGRGVVQDYNRALDYLLFSAAQGYGLAVEKVKALNITMH